MGKTDKRKRTFSITKAVLEKLGVLNDCYHIEKSSFIRMAIYHGIERINNGYYPYRNHNLKKMEKQKYHVTLPEETWNAFEDMKEKAEYKLEEKIPDGELIEMFIRVEIKGYLEFVNQCYKDDKLDDAMLFEKTTPITVTADIPNILFFKYKNEIESTGLLGGKVGKYLITNALLQECCHTSYEMIDTDADLIRYIDACGLHRYKTLNLLKNLIKSNKIILLNDKNLDY